MRTGWSLAVSGPRGGAWGLAEVDFFAASFVISPHGLSRYLAFFVVLVFSVARLKWMHDDGIVNCCVEGRVQPICDQ